MIKGYSVRHAYAVVEPLARALGGPVSEDLLVYHLRGPRPPRYADGALRRLIAEARRGSRIELRTFAHVKYYSLVDGPAPRRGRAVARVRTSSRE